MLEVISNVMPKDEMAKISSQLYRKIQKCIETFRFDHMIRMRERSCDPETGLMYEKTLTAMERISSYISNAAKLAV